MSTNFARYAEYYDLFYSEKNYQEEVEYLERLVSDCLAKKPRSMLELGCGTGIHASCFANKGVAVVGIDVSEQMLQMARERKKRHPLVGGELAFEYGDIRNYRCDLKFDVVASLFHVFSYQTSDADLRGAFRTAAEHLAPGGVFAFDFWYGPAVLWQRPTIRVKSLSTEAIEVTRLSVPTLLSAENLVNVAYSVYVRDRMSDLIEAFREEHLMRYLFLKEIDAFLADAGMARIRTEEWGTGSEIGVDTWGVCVVASSVIK